MKHSCLALTLLVFAGFAAVDSLIAQGNGGVTLTGSVVELKRSTDWRKAKENQALWNLDLVLVLRNTGSKPVLLYDCFGENGCSEKLEFLRENISYDDTGSHVSDTPFFAYKSTDPSVYYWGWNSTIRQLDTPQPSSLVIILQPGQLIERRQSFEVYQKFRKSGAKGSSVWENSDRSDDDISPGSLSVSDAPKLKIQYSFVPMESIYPCETDWRSPRDYSKCVRPYHDPELLIKLQRSWKSYGDFLLDSTGAFRMTSEAIVNLPKSPEEQPTEKNSNPK